jgi:hypothetical protein
LRLVAIVSVDAYETPAPDEVRTVLLGYQLALAFDARAVVAE